MSSLGVTLLDGVHAQLALMSRMSLLPVVKVVVSVTECGPSLTQSVGRAVVASLTMFPSNSKAPALPTSVSAKALVKSGTAIASVISVITIAACTYRLETSHFVLVEISPIVDNIFLLPVFRGGVKECEQLSARRITLL